jgi:hypothetical protein
MAATAFEAMYRDEFINGFEMNQSLLRGTVTTQAMIKGLSATFLIALASRSATTRGSDGLIPKRSDNLSQVTVTLKERHDLTGKTGFNIFAGQSDQRRILQMEGIKVINREIDDEILLALSAATVTTGAAAAMSPTLIQKALTTLFNAEVPNDGNIFGLLSPAAWFYMTDITSFSSSDYTRNRPMDQGAPRGPAMVEWNNVKWMMHPRLTGVGTSSTTMFIWHRDAIGHAIDSRGIQAYVGFDEQQDESWQRHTVYHAAKILQNSGIVKVVHDDSGLVL